MQSEKAGMGCAKARGMRGVNSITTGGVNMENKSFLSEPVSRLCGSFLCAPGDLVVAISWGGSVALITQHGGKR